MPVRLRQLDTGSGKKPVNYGQVGLLTITASQGVGGRLSLPWPQSAMTLSEVDQAGAVPHPAIGVVIPCYESRRFLRTTLESVLCQTRRPRDVVVVDDGSNDNPETVVADLVRQHDRIRLVRQENAGVAMARNRGADLLTDCDFVLFPDADDVLEPRMVERLASVLQSNPVAAIAWCLPEFIDDQGYPAAAAVWARRRRRRGLWRVEAVPDETLCVPVHDPWDRSLGVADEDECIHRRRALGCLFRTRLRRPRPFPPTQAPGRRLVCPRTIGPLPASSGTIDLRP